MKKIMFIMALAPLAALADLHGDTPNAKHAWAVHDINRPKPSEVTPAAKPGGAPSDAIVLFDGTKASFEKNWCDENGNPSLWTYNEDGSFSCPSGWKSVFTRAKFGDCQLHIEYRHDPKKIFTNQGPQMRGNSGVFLMNNYEIQVLDSYGTSRERVGKPGYVENYADGQAGAVYAENPPLVNPARPAGEWQVYDIVFHQPVWDGKKLLHPGSVTVFFNGVLVQDHWEMEGLTTYRFRRPLAPHEKVGPLMLQNHGCLVYFRNIWYRPLESRWANTTCSEMSANCDDVMALRRETAAKLYAKIADPKKPDVPTIKALGEVISYANEGRYADDFKACLEAYRANPGAKEDVKRLNDALDILIRNKVIPETMKVAVP